MTNKTNFKTVEQLTPVLDVTQMLAFCQEHQVEIIRGEDWLYNGYIGPSGAAQCWSAELDAYSALVMAIYNYTKRTGSSELRLDGLI